MFYVLFRSGSGFISSIPKARQFERSDEPRFALKFWTRKAALRFKEAHRESLRGGWRVTAANPLAALWSGFCGADVFTLAGQGDWFNLGLLFARFRRT